ncbi:MAG: LysR family transcriptional regulator [Myxococcales bacterium]|nr:LysR family transcriptional regulator [Myxococcales bacterium]
MSRSRSTTTRERALSRWDDVRVFLTALRAGSFTRAAIELGTDQSTVSRRIASLEGALGVTLFERTRRAPVPTEDAARLREAAEQVEASLARFADAATGLRTQAIEGRVRLALTEEIAVHFVVPHVIPKLRAAHPGLSLDLVTGYRAADLASREADIALRFFQTERGDLVGKRIARFRTAILGSKAYARRVRNLSLAELDWIAVELAGLATPESAWLEAHVRRPPVLVCSSYQTQVAAIRSGLGVGIGPLALTKLERSYMAIDVRPRPEMPVLDLYVVTRRAIRDLPRIVAVLEALDATLGPLGDRIRPSG